MGRGEDGPAVSMAGLWRASETNRQMSLAEQPPSVYGETSEAAAEAIKPSAARLRTRVYERLVLAGWDGMTDEELQVALRMPPSTQRPRRVELVKMGTVIDSGRKRRTVSGRKAIVWVAQ